MDGDDLEELLDEVGKKFMLVFGILSLLFILSELILGGYRESQNYYEGQRFKLEGTGDLYVGSEKEGCIVILQFMDKTVKTVIPQKDEISGLFYIVENINGQVSGRLIDAPRDGCKIRANGLKSEFNSSLLGTELLNILLASFWLTSFGMGIVVFSFFLINKLS